MCENEIPPFCYDKLIVKMKKMFIIQLTINILLSAIIIVGGFCMWKRLKANIFFTYNMTRETTEKLNHVNIYWDSGIHQIILKPIEN